MRVRVDRDGLASSGAAVAGVQAPIAATEVPAAAGDPVSQGAAAILTARSAQFSMMVDHSGLLREQGGLVLSATTDQFGAADEEVADRFGSGGGPAAGAAMSSLAGAAPTVPTLPALPALPPPPTMPGDVFSKLLHGSAAGSSGLRAAASAWRGHASTLHDLADQMLAHGQNIDQQWQDDGHNRAAANVTHHGHWLRDRGDDAEEFARSIDAIADHHDQAVQNTPTPDRFEELRREADRLAATNRNGMNTSAIMQCRAQYAELAGVASEQAMVHHGSTSAELAKLTKPIEEAPPIAGHGDVQALGFGPGGAPETPQGQDPPHGKDPRYWIDVGKIIYVPDGKLAPWGTTQIGPNMYYPTGTPYQSNPPPAPVQHPLDIPDVRVVQPGQLLPPGYKLVAPGIGLPDPDAYFQPQPPWIPKAPVDIRDVIPVGPNALAPWGYVEFMPGWWCPGPELTNSPNIPQMPRGAGG